MDTSIFHIFGGNGTLSISNLKNTPQNRLLRRAVLQFTVSIQSASCRSIENDVITWKNVQFLEIVDTSVHFHVLSESKTINKFDKAAPNIFIKKQSMLTNLKGVPLCFFKQINKSSMWSYKIMEKTRGVGSSGRGSSGMKDSNMNSTVNFHINTLWKDI